MARVVVPIASGLLLGWAASYVLFLGRWTLLPWGAVALALGYWNGKREALLAGAIYGFTLSFVFMVAGYRGSASLISRAPFFVVLGLFGAFCGLVLAAWGARLKRGSGPASPS